MRAAQQAERPSVQGATDQNTGGGPTTTNTGITHKAHARDLSWYSSTSCCALLPHMFGLNRSTTYAGGTDFGYRTRMAGRLVSTVLAAPRTITVVGFLFHGSSRHALFTPSPAPPPRLRGQSLKIFYADRLQTSALFMYVMHVLAAVTARFQGMSWSPTEYISCL